MSRASSKNGESANGESAQPEIDPIADTVLPNQSRGSVGPKDAGDNLVGSVIAETYELLEKLGQGGMGVVYRARHHRLEEEVAVKVLLDKHADKDLIVARLKKEARLASSIGHQNIIDITDVGTTEDGRTFVVMEYLQGESLGELLARRGKLPTQRVVDIGVQIASALSAAHAKSIIHRDVKPENIFLIEKEELDFVKVVDFGVSKSMIDEDDIRLTHTGMVIGTPLYMSPEQARGDDDLDHQIDIYALGVILYEATTGQVPFQGQNYLNILTQVISETPKKPSELVEGFDTALEAVILKATAKEREDRYQDMDELVHALRELQTPETRTKSAHLSTAKWGPRKSQRPRSSYLAWALGIVAIAGVSVWGAIQALDSVPTKEAEAEMRAGHGDEIPNTVIRIVSKPAGALVLEGAVEVCRATPCDFRPEAKAKEAVLLLRKPGYEEAKLTLQPERDAGKERGVELQQVLKN